MRILTISPQSYPSERASYILMHQSMALEDLGHEVHLHNSQRRIPRLMDHLQAFEFDLIILEVDVLSVEEVWRTLRQYRRMEPVRVVASLNRLPAVPEGPAWEIVDLVFTPWKGESHDRMSALREVKYLPLGYNPRLHGRETDLPPLGPVFVGDTCGSRNAEASEYLSALQAEHAVLCIGPAFEQKSIDPMMLGRLYAASRCLPNFHYACEKQGEFILNERFWQTARCGIPVNDYSPLMREVWSAELMDHFSFADTRDWQSRIRSLKSGAVAVPPEIRQQLHDAMQGHSYRERMKQLLVWLE
jgi:hypothetical protein